QPRVVVIHALEHVGAGRGDRLRGEGRVSGGDFREVGETEVRYAVADRVGGVGAGDGEIGMLELTDGEKRLAVLTKLEEGGVDRLIGGCVPIVAEAGGCTITGRVGAEPSWPHFGV